MKVSFSLIRSETYLCSLVTISQSTSWRVRSRGPKLLTKSSSAASLQLDGGWIVVLLPDK